MDDQKKPRDHNTGSDTSSSETTDDVTSEFECNLAREAANLISAETHMGGSELDDDFQRHLTSRDEREMLNVSPWLREAVR